MRILIDGRPMVDPNGGGIPRVANGLIPVLVEQALSQHHDVRVLTTGTRIPTTDRLANLPHQHLRIPNRLHSVAMLAHLTSFERGARDFPPDMLFLPNLAFIGQPRCPYAILIHDLSFLREPRWFSWRARVWHRAIRPLVQIQNAAHLFAVSETTKQDLIEQCGVPETRITVIPMAIAATSAERAPLPSDLVSKRYLLALGGNDPRKNTACAMAAWETLRKEEAFRDVQLVVCGGKNRPTDAALNTLFAEAGAFLYPSWYEGFGLPLHEAALHGTPCVASTAGALSETAPRGTLFAPPAKPHLWVEAIRRVLHAPDSHRTHTVPRDWTFAADVILSTLQKKKPLIR